MPVPRETPTPNPPLPFSAGDVVGLGDAITLISFEAGSYTLTAVDNDTDRPNGRPNPRGNLESGQLRWHPSGSYEPAVWALGAQRSRPRERNEKSARICRGSMGKTERGMTLNFALTTEVPPKA
jgi:hypothetical protein